MNAILIVLTVLSAFLIFRFLNQIDAFKPHNPHHHESCKRIPIDLPSEDLIQFGDFAVGGAADYLPMFQKHLDADNAREGFLYSFHLKSSTVRKLKINGFPANFKLSPHGLHLYNNKTLYFINHGFSHGGDNVILVDLEYTNGELKANYVKKVFVGPEFGIYNSIHVINSQYFYLTQFIPDSLDEKGKDLSFWNEISLTLRTFFLKSNSIKLCLVLVDQAICSPRAYGYMPNGIGKVKNQLLVADSIANSIGIYSISEAYELSLIETVKFTHSVDNIRIQDDVVYVSGIERAFEYLLFNEEAKKGSTERMVPGGVSKMYKKSGKWVSEEIMMQNQLSLPSVALPLSKHIILGSFADPAILICPLN